MKKCIDVIYDEIGRIYVYDDGTRYHSVTTMLGATADKSNLVFWKRRVGEEEAQRVSEEAAAMGEAFHLLGEKFLLNQPLPIVDRKIRRTFASAKSILTNNVTKVHAVEAPLITETYKLSGRVDAVVDWNGQLAILDFKLLGNHDTFWLTDYWLQTTIYAQAWKEMYGDMPKKCILVVGSKADDKTKFFVSNPTLWKGKVHRRCSEFQRMLNI